MLMLVFFPVVIVFIVAMVMSVIMPMTVAMGMTVPVRMTVFLAIMAMRMFMFVLMFMLVFIVLMRVFSVHTDLHQLSVFKEAFSPGLRRSLLPTSREALSFNYTHGCQG